MVTDLQISYWNIFCLFLNTTLFYNFMLPVNRYLAMNTFCRSMTYYQKSHSLQLKGIRPLLCLVDSLSWWRLFQIRVVCTKLDIYVYIMIGWLLISIYIIDDSRSVHTVVIFMTFYLIYWTLAFTPCNTSGSTCGTETDYPSEAFAFTSDFYGVPCCLYLVFCAVYNYLAGLLLVSHQSVAKSLQNLIERVLIITE